MTVSTEARARPPVLFLAGVGLTASVALRSIAALEPHFRVLAAPDARPPDRTPQAARDRVPDLAPSWGQIEHEPAGAGASAALLSLTSAEDAVALLDRARAPDAHVVGLSYGASIAQEVAIRHPDRVRSLVLCSSTAGGSRYVAPEPAIRRFLRRLADLPPEEGLWATVPYLYAEATYRGHAPMIGEDIARRLLRPLDPRAHRREHAVARAHDASARLQRITAPTLVVHGERDRILPLANGRLLAAGISGARLIALPDAAHALPTDVPGVSGELVSFLLAHSPPAAPAATRTAPAARA
jgi:3-oxoadipate enol-lactonase